MGRVWGSRVPDSELIEVRSRSCDYPVIQDCNRRGVELRDVEGLEFRVESAQSIVEKFCCTTAIAMLEGLGFRKRCKCFLNMSLNARAQSSNLNGEL